MSKRQGSSPGSLDPATLRCTVIVPTYNRAELLDRTLRSLRRQSIGASRFQVVVADDGSSDNSKSVALSHTDALDLEYCWQEDLGFRVAAARNIGLRCAKHPISVFIDAGVVLQDGCLEGHLDEHRRGRCAVIGYTSAMYTGTRQEAATSSAPLTSADNRDTRASDGLDAREELYKDVRDDLSRLSAPWVAFWTCNASVRTQDAYDAGLFDENFQSWGGEDVEFAYRLHKSGIPLVLSRAAAAAHMPHESNRIQNARSAAANYRYFARKHADPSVVRLLTTRFWK